MDRIDGKGIHPTARPYRPHWKRERSKIKVMRVALPIAKQIEVLWTKFGAFTTEKGERVLNKLIDLVVLDSNETAIGPMYGGEINYGAVGDYSMQHADPSRSPPKHGWMQKVMRYAAVFFLVGIMALATACKKAPVPEPNTNSDPVIPTKEVTIHWNWKANLGWAPPMDTIKYYTDQDDVKFVDINIIGNEGPGSPVNCTGVTPGPFHRARDTLQTRIDIDSTKVRLSGTIVVNSDNGATLQNHDSTQDMGMAYYDSIWFTDHGCTVRRPIYTR